MDCQSFWWFSHLVFLDWSNFSSPRRFSPSHTSKTISGTFPKHFLTGMPRVTKTMFLACSGNFSNFWCTRWRMIWDWYTYAVFMHNLGVPGSHAKLLLHEHLEHPKKSMDNPHQMQLHHGKSWKGLGNPLKIPGSRRKFSIILTTSVENP